MLCKSGKSGHCDGARPVVVLAAWWQRCNWGQCGRRAQVCARSGGGGHRTLSCIWQHWRYNGYHDNTMQISSPVSLILRMQLKCMTENDCSFLVLIFNSETELVIFFHIAKQPQWPVFFVWEEMFMDIMTILCRYDSISITMDINWTIELVILLLLWIS